jgi:hypothetical protein
MRQLRCNEACQNELQLVAHAGSLHAPECDMAAGQHAPATRPTLAPCTMCRTPRASAAPPAAQPAAQPTHSHRHLSPRTTLRTCPCRQQRHGQAPSSAQAQGASDGDVLRHILSHVQQLGSDMQGLHLEVRALKDRVNALQSSRRH